VGSVGREGIGSQVYVGLVGGFAVLGCSGQGVIDINVSVGALGCWLAAAVVMNVRRYVCVAQEQKSK